MKFVVDNYSNNHSSQSLYIDSFIKHHTDHESVLNNGELPIFDMMDVFDPDVYITHCNILSPDVIAFIKQSSKPIHLMVNIDNSKQAYIYNVEQALLSNDVKFMFFANCSITKPLTKKTNVFNLLDTFDEDLVINRGVKTKYHTKIEYLFFITKDTDITNINLKQLEDNDSTFHICSFSSQTGEIFSSVLHAKNHLYDNYDNVVFANLEYGLNQAFFDAIHGGNKVYFSASNEHKNKINSVLKKIFKIDQSLDINDNDRLENFNDLRAMVTENMNVQKRVNSLLSQVPNLK